jgi:nicotinate-nucleotide adenylyltransferase
MNIANHKKALIFLGGSFDPIHLGHINTAIELQKKFPNAQLIFLPCGTPALKDFCKASKANRLEMMKIALKNHPQFLIDTREFHKESPSYTIETLKEIRHTLEKDTSVSFVIGQDAFSDFMKWHDWKNILKYCHIINHERPEHNPLYSQELQDFIKQHETFNTADIYSNPNGYIYRINLGNYPYSSTAIRYAFKTHQNPQGLPHELVDYIQKNHLYC